MNNKKIESIIKAYKILKQQNPDSWIRDCSSSKKIEDAIELAATARNSINKKHKHQFRIPNSTLNTFSVAILDKSDQFKKEISFDELTYLVDSCRVKGIGDLTIYDTAQRIGGFLKKDPDKVYLHRGTRTGAEIFFGKIKDKHIMIDKLPAIFQNSDLTAGEIEDILCIYKERLKTCV